MWADCVDKLNELEKLFILIERIINKDKCLNITNGGNRISDYPCKESTRDKLSIASKKTWSNPEHREMMSGKLSKLKWFNNGLYELRSKEKPEGNEWIEGRLPDMYSEEYKDKMSDINKDLKWFNNGNINVFVKECPEGFMPGRVNVDYQKGSQMMSIKGKGRKYYTNGVINIKIKGDPPEGFVSGITSTLSDEENKRLSNNRKNAKYYHKGILQIRVVEPPDDTWIKGKLYNKIPDDWKYYNNGKFILRAPECPEGFKLGKIPRNHKKKK